MSEPTLAHPGRHVAFTVHGVPQPAGSKRAFVTPKTGRIVVVDDAKGSRPWKNRVAAAAAEAMDGPPLSGPVELLLTFSVTRPRGHYGVGRNSDIVKPSAPVFPTVRPDITKLVRAAEDAMTGIVWKDDAQVIAQHADKRYGPSPHVTVEVLSLEPAATP